MTSMYHTNVHVVKTCHEENQEHIKQIGRSWEEIYC